MGKTSRTPGPGKKILDQIIKDSKLEARIGFFPSAQYANGIDVAYIATIQEYGCPERSIPPRPFMRPTMDQERGSWRGIVDGALQPIVAGRMTVKDLLTGIGAQAAGDVQKAISQVSDPPLSPITMMARKFKKDGGDITSAKQIGGFARELDEMKARGEAPDFSGVSDKPLNDSGLLIASVQSMVVSK